MGGRGSSSASGEQKPGAAIRTKIFSSSSGSKKTDTNETDKMFTALGTKKSK